MSGIAGQKGSARRRATHAAALAVLLVASAVLRTRDLGAGYWIDEGLSVGIAAHPLGELPGLLAHDGSPPLYYALLHAWMAIAGDGETATAVPSLVAALAAVPAALWAGRALFGPRAGWAAAGVAATVPLLTVHAQETRMYALVALLSILATAAFAIAFLAGSRRMLAAFAVLAALLLYTHNWALFLLFGLACALPLAARRRGVRPVARDAALAGAAIALAYAPWLPTLLDQAAHTGAPWSTVPDLAELLSPAAVPLGGGLGAILAATVAAAGLLKAHRDRNKQPNDRPRGPRSAVRGRTNPALLLAIALVAGATCAWTAAQVEPAWADRYTSAFTGPVVLLVGAGLAAAGRAGLVALAAAMLIWTLDPSPSVRSNVREVARETAARVQPNDVVIATHPEQVAVARHYLGPGLRWATTLGPEPDPSTFSWREALGRLRAADPAPALDRAVRGAAGRRIVLLRPVRLPAGRAPWLDAVRRTSARWVALAEAHPRLRRVEAIPARPPQRAGRSDVQTLVYEVRAP